MSIYLIVNFLIGACLASHACVIYERFDQGGIIWSRSRCNFCYSELSLLDEIPLFSFLFLKGRCRYCKNLIPAQLFLAELIGGFAFLNCNFASYYGIKTAILIFSLLLCAIFDYKTQEFPTICLIPAILITLTDFSLPTTFEFIQFVIIFLLLFYYVLKKQLGSGDLLIYIILAVYFNVDFANYTFLLASIIYLIQFVFTMKKIDRKQTFPLVPYLFIALVLILLRN